MRDRLSARQREVLRMTAAGFTSAQAARRLGVSPTTVVRHLADIYKMLGAHDRAHAVALGIWRGDITLADLAEIAAGGTVQGVETSPEPTGAPVSRQEPVEAVPFTRDAGDASQRRTEPRGEAAA